jgi:MFS family permease
MAPSRSIPNLSAWLVVVLCFLALALAFSARAALSLVMPMWERDLGWTKSFISGAGAAALIIMACVAPFAGRLVDKHGPGITLVAGLLAVGLGAAAVSAAGSKVLFVVGFSIISAIGFGIVATHVVSTAVARLFEANRGLAIGIATSGATAGQFLIVPLIAYILAVASWRWSYLGLTLGCFALLPALWLLLNHERRDQSGDQNDRSGDWRADLGLLVRQPVFHGLFWSFLLCGYTTTGIIETHLIPYSAFCGFPPLPSATAYGVLSAVNFAGMILAGWLADRMHRPTLLGGIYMVRGLTFLILMNVGASYETLLTFALAFGVVDYATVPVTASLAASHLGIERMGLAMGLISAGHAVGGALGAFLGGYVFDLTGSYSLVWWSGVWLAVLAGILVLPLGERGLQARMAQ